MAMVMSRSKRLREGAAMHEERGDANRSGSKRAEGARVCTFLIAPAGGRRRRRCPWKRFEPFAPSLGGDFQILKISPHFTFTFTLTTTTTTHHHHHHHHDGAKCTRHICYTQHDL
jgi:hypothetical protein